MPKAKTAYGSPAKAETAFVEEAKPDTDFAKTSKPDTSYTDNPDQITAINYNDPDFTYSDPTMFYVGYDVADLVTRKPHTATANVPKNSTEFGTITKEQTGYS